VLTPPELAGATAAPSSGLTTNPSPTCYCDLTGLKSPHPEADYYLGYRGDGRKVWENVGNSLPGVIRALEKKHAGLA